MCQPGCESIRYERAGQCAMQGMCPSFQGSSRESLS